MNSTALDNNPDEGLLAKRKQSKKIHLEKIISPIPVPYYVGWLICAAAFLLISYLILVRFETSTNYIDVFLIISVIIALEGIAVSWAHNMLESFDQVLINVVDLPEEAVITWYEAQKADIFNDKKMVLFAIIFIAFVHASGIDYHAVSFDSSISDAVLKIEYYFAVYIEGIGLYIGAMTARTVYKIGTLRLKVNALYSDFHAIGMLYSKFTILAASTYIVWGFFHLIVPPQFSPLQIIIWFLFFAILLLAYFILPQYSIHRMMASTKKEKTELFSSQLRAALDKSIDDPTDESALHLRDMLSVQNRLDQISEWPFGIYEILCIVLIIVIPLIIVLLEIMLGIIK